MYEKACFLLEQGDLVAMPTETVYGLAADALNTQAIEKIYQTKGRPSFNPLIIHVSDLDMAKKYGVFSTSAQDIALHFWFENPKPLTFVVPFKKESGISPLVTANLSTIAIRRPHHPIALSLIEKFQKPLAAPSANISNTISPTKPEMIRKQFPDLYVLEGGECEVGLESTIIDAERFEILRPGGCTQKDLEDFLEKSLSVCDKEETIRCPGQMVKHYAPSIPLRCNATSYHEGEAWITFGLGNKGFSISPEGNLQEAAAKLYATLFEIDHMKIFSGIAVFPIPQEGLGIAINNRLERAAWKK